MKKKSAVLAVTAAWVITTVAGAQDFDAPRKETVTSELAKSMLYGDATIPSYKWGNHGPKLKANTSPRLSNADPKPVRLVATEGMQAYNRTQNLDTKFSGATYRWGIRSTADLMTYRWGIRASSEQKTYRWGIRASSEQKTYRWGIR